MFWLVWLEMQISLIWGAEPFLCISIFPGFRVGWTPQRESWGLIQTSQLFSSFLEAGAESLVSGCLGVIPAFAFSSYKPTVMLVNLSKSESPHLWNQDDCSP